MTYLDHNETVPQSQPISGWKLLHAVAWLVIIGSFVVSKL